MIAFIIALSFFMEAMDTTIVNTAIPALSRSLAVDPLDLKMALISYLVGLAVFIPISSWLADKFGAKKIFIISLFIFTASSLWCGFASNIQELIISRFIQGLGGALGLPVGRLLILRIYGRQHLIPNMNYIITVGAVGTMFGPAIGGLITHYFSWHWIFWVNIPVGLFAMLLAGYFLPNVEPQNPHSLDKIGFLLFGCALAGLTFGLSALSDSAISISVAFVILLISGLLIMSYIIHSYRRTNPIIKIHLMSLRTFQVSMASNLVSRLGFGGIPFLVPLLLQITLEFSPKLSGMLLVPTGIGVLVGKRLVLPLLHFFGFKKLLIINTSLAGLSIWAFILVNAETPIYIIGLLTFIYGLMASIQYTSMNSLGYADVPPEDLSTANSMTNTLQQLAQSFGVAIGALFIRFFTIVFPMDPALTLQVFHWSFFALGFFTLLSVLIFMRLRHGDGHQMLKH
jgi:EmrB/QacA subfamily drug resistance transporter